MCLFQKTIYECLVGVDQNGFVKRKEIYLNVGNAAVEEKMVNDRLLGSRILITRIGPDDSKIN